MKGSPEAGSLSEMGLGAGSPNAGHCGPCIHALFQWLGRSLPRALSSVKEFNSLAARRYSPQAYDGKVTLFWASGDLRASNDLIEGWRALSRGGIEVQEIPGTHLDIIKEPHVGMLASKLSECLERAQSAASNPTA